MGITKDLPKDPSEDGMRQYMESPWHMLSIQQTLAFYIITKQDYKAMAKTQPYYFGILPIKLATVSAFFKSYLRWALSLILLWGKKMCL